MDRQTDRQTDEQTKEKACGMAKREREIDSWTNIQSDRQMDREMKG